MLPNKVNLLKCPPFPSSLTISSSTKVLTYYLSHVFNILTVISLAQTTLNVQYLPQFWSVVLWIVLKSFIYIVYIFKSNTIEFVFTFIRIMCFKISKTVFIGKISLSIYYLSILVTLFALVIFKFLFLLDNKNENNINTYIYFPKTMFVKVFFKS